MQTVILKKKDGSKTKSTDTTAGSTTNPLQPKQPTNNPLQLQAEETTISQPQQNNTGLPDNLKSGVEALSGLSMDDVKVHYNSDKPAQLQALAYAQGTDIHIAPGQEKHLPHEAWHVVQQKQGRVQATMQMKQGIAVNDDKGLEEEADVMGTTAIQYKTASTQSEDPQTDHTVYQKFPIPTIQRQKAADAAGAWAVDQVVTWGTSEGKPVTIRVLARAFHNHFPNGWDGKIMAGVRAMWDDIKNKRDDGSLRNLY